jgi:flagellar hook-associated protein 3 FlgL
MRITPFMVYDQLQQAIQNTQAKYARINNQLGTQKKILSPSDDVSGSLRVLDYQVNISANDQFKNNVNTAMTNLNLTDTTLSSFSSSVAQVKEILFSSINGIIDTSSRTANAQKAAQLRDSLLGMANTDVGGRYLFSGYNSDTRPYNTTTYAYQGDNGDVNIPIDHGVTMAMNVTGGNAFSYTLGAAYVKQIPSGANVHYTPGAGTTINVEIRDQADTTVLDTFSFSNVLQMTDILSTAVNNNDVNRIQALIDPFNSVQNQLSAASATVGARLSSLNDQTTLLNQNTSALKNSLSTIQDIDMTETAVELQKADTTLQALYAASAKIMSQSLLDFLE